MQNEEVCKLVLLAYIGEKIANSIDNRKEEYFKIREALNFCWKWIENKQVDEEKIYEFLDDEEGDDLVYYYTLSTNTERERKEYGVILGIVSYISLDILEANKLPIPQFLSGIDENYYDLIISDVIQLNIANCMKENINEVIEYCKDKIAKKDLMFTKSGIMNLKI